MDEIEKFVATRNKEELLRIYEMKLNEEISDEEKKRLNEAIADVKEKLDKLNA